MARIEEVIASESDVKEGKLHKFSWEGRPILMFRHDGNIYAYIDVCTHVGGSLDLKNNQLICEWHSSIFDPTTGKYVRGVAPTGSELIPLSIESRNGKILYVYPPNRPRGQWHIVKATAHNVTH
jgi:nitrite reductase/ring-hydroxylating ferredoxin subunit